MRSRCASVCPELERHYRSCGWKVERAGDGTVRAAGVGGVTWIGLAVVGSDLDDESLAQRLVELSDVRMGSDGPRCPLELLPDPACAGQVRSLLERLRLAECVSLYSLAA